MIKNNDNALDILLDVLKKAGYTEQQSIELLARFLDENKIDDDLEKDLESFYKSIKDPKIH